MRRALSSLAARARAGHASGSMYFLGMCASGTAATVLYLQTAREQEIRHALDRDFERQLVVAQSKAREEMATNRARLEGAPTLWSGVLTEADPRLSGPKMFRGRTGQTVDVLEENVGSDGRYLTVVDRESGVLGMYLADWVRKAA